MSERVFMFPGQASRYPEMLERLATLAPQTAQHVLDEASEVLGCDVRRHYRADNPRIFATGRDVQVGVFLANHLSLRSLQAAGIDAELSLGHSLGEYNHLVHIGALAFADALRLVEARGEAYDNGPDGAMASVFPIELDDLSDVIDRASDEEWGTLEVAHLNSPTQHVISGERAAVDAALGLLNDRHLVETLVIEDRLPMHSSRFAPVARKLRPILERAPWRKPYRAYQPNVEGRPIESPSADAIVDSLARQACRPVLWRMSIEQLVHRHRDLTFIEVGPRSLLYNLLQRNWLPNRRLKIDTSGDLRTNFAQLVDELTRSA